ncbi:MAG TPA: hypothetical protein VGL93_34945 [Streptosporangiaceae bacterium]
MIHARDVAGTIEGVLGVVSGLAVIVGGIVFFVVGRRRGALAGAGFVTLAVGTVATSAWSVVVGEPLTFRDARGGPLLPGTLVELLLGVAGWAMVVVAVVLLRPKRPPVPPFPPPPAGPVP